MQAHIERVMSDAGANVYLGEHMDNGGKVSGDISSVTWLPAAEFRGNETRCCLQSGHPAVLAAPLRCDGYYRSSALLESAFGIGDCSLAEMAHYVSDDSVS